MYFTKNKGGYLGHHCWLPLNHKWRKDVKSFDNMKEKGMAQHLWLRMKYWPTIANSPKTNLVSFTSNKRKRDASNSLHDWHKRNIFFELPYWRKLKIQHNLDVMHIETNVSENILGTSLNIKGKTKDTIRAWIDLMNIGIRKELHPTVDGDKVQIPVPCYILNSNAKATLCKMFEELKSPDGYLSNISWCLKDNGKKNFLFEKPWPSCIHWPTLSFCYLWILAEECVWAIDWVKYVFSKSWRKKT